MTMTFDVDFLLIHFFNYSSTTIQKGYYCTLPDLTFFTQALKFRSRVTEMSCPRPYALFFRAPSLVQRTPCPLSRSCKILSSRHRAFSFRREHYYLFITKMMKRQYLPSFPLRILTYEETFFIFRMRHDCFHYPFHAHSLRSFNEYHVPFFNMLQKIATRLHSVPYLNDA